MASAPFCGASIPAAATREAPYNRCKTPSTAGSLLTLPLLASPELTGPRKRQAAFKTYMESTVARTQRHTVCYLSAVVCAQMDSSTQSRDKAVHQLKAPLLSPE